MEHTPLRYDGRDILDSAGMIVARMGSPELNPLFDCEANAAYIVKAVNHHEELVKALSLTIRTINDTLRHGLTSGQLDALGEVTEVSRAILQRTEKGE